MKKWSILLILFTFLSFGLFAQNSGGPDYFGYRWINSFEEGGPEYDWVIPTANAASFDLFDDDHTAIDIGFDFPYYGYDYEVLYISSNGFVSFGGVGMDDHSSTLMPHGTYPNATIAWWWMDLNPNENVYPNTNAFYETVVVDSQNACVVSFYNYTQYGVGSEQPTNSITAQVILFEDGSIKIQYQSIGDFAVDEDNPLSIGIEDEAGAGGLPYLFIVDPDAPVVENSMAEEMALLFTRPYENDLMGWNIFGNTSPGVGVETQYTVKIQNVGSNPQSDYQVKLFKEDGTMIQTVEGIEIEAAHNHLFELNYIPDTIGQEAIYGQVFLDGDDDPTNDATMQLQLTIIDVGSLDGHVLNDNGDPVESATIQINGSILEAETDASGYYQFESVPIGNHNITCSKFGYTSEQIDNVSVVANQTTEQDFTINPLETITLSGTFKAFQDTSVAVEGLNLTLEGYDNYQTTTDENGYFEFNNVYSNKMYALTGSLDYFINYTQDIFTDVVDMNLGMLVIQADTPQVASLSYQISESEAEINLSWTLNDTIDSFQGFNLYRFPQADFSHPEQWDTIASGITDTTFVDPYWYTLPSGNYFYAVRAIYVLDLESTPTYTPNIGQVFTHTVVIRTVTSSGLPIQNVAVNLYDATGNENYVYEGNTDQTGYFVVDNVFRGYYNLELSHPGYVDQTIEGISIYNAQNLNYQLSINSNDEDEAPQLVTALQSNYPNPFNPTTTISFSLATKERANLCIYNLLGQKVKTIVNDTLEPGNYSFEWNGKDNEGKKVGSGVYFYKLSTSTYKKINKMVMLK